MAATFNLPGSTQPAADPSRKSTRPPIRTCILLALSWVAFAGVMWLLDRQALNVTPDAYRGAWTLTINALVAFSAWLLLASVTRRPFTSLLLLAALQCALYIAAGMKLELLQSPLTLPDLHFLTEVNVASIQLFGSYLDLPGGPWPWLVVALAVMIGIFTLEPASVPRLGTVRLGAFAIGMALTATLYLAAWPWTAIYTEERMRPSPFNDLPGILRAGLVGSLVHSYLHARSAAPQVDEEALHRTLALLQDQGMPTASPAIPAVQQGNPAPDIVMVLSESFMDPRALHGFDSIDDPIPFVRSVINSGRGGAMHVQAYGGGTVRTEFEVVTGMPIDAFPAVTYPYRDLRQTHIPGVVSVLGGHGYSTLAVHGNSGSFWNRTNTYHAMGMERFITDIEFKQKAMQDGLWYSDESMTDFMLQALQETSQPAFVLAISIQNHGPYNRPLPLRDMAAWNDIEVPASLNEDDALVMRNYLYHLRAADRQLQRLHEELVRRGRPFVLVFFGDHLPAMDLFEELGFVDGQTPQQQPVPWILLSEGTEIDMNLPETAIPAWQLPALALQAAGIHDDYFDFITRAAELQARLPSDSSDVTVLARGIHSAANARLDGRFGTYLQ